MTKGEIKKLASNVDLMDILNTVSGLLEMNNQSDQELIEQLINDIYQKLQADKKKRITKAEMLHYIMDYDYKMYQNIKQQNWITVYKIYERIKGGSVNDR